VSRWELEGRAGADLGEGRFAAEAAAAAAVVVGRRLQELGLSFAA
jgi:hypothetical protein